MSVKKIKKGSSNKHTTESVFQSSNSLNLSVRFLTMIRCRRERHVNLYRVSARSSILWRGNGSIIFLVPNLPLLRPTLLDRNPWLKWWGKWAKENNHRIYVSHEQSIQKLESIVPSWCFIVTSLDGLNLRSITKLPYDDGSSTWDTVINTTVVSKMRTYILIDETSESGEIRRHRGNSHHCTLSCNWNGII